MLGAAGESKLMSAVSVQHLPVVALFAIYHLFGRNGWHTSRRTRCANAGAGGLSPALPH